ncbi:MAG: GDSL-type esterase/lipase family protein [Planctomycetota bacterium]|jgi:lysophospholipase L1-like esterase|nr:GDSL-type esterase/lipase family protein [Planctomycetota bacterium]
MLCLQSISAMEPPSWQEISRTIAIDPERFEQILCAGHDEVVRIAILGDSQEMCPGGSGCSYLPNINLAFFDRIGAIGETPVLSHWSIGSSSPAAWLWRAAVASPNGAATTLPAASILPGVRVRSHRSVDSSAQSYGLLGMLLHDGSLNGDPQIPQFPYFDNASTHVVAELVAATRPESGGATWRAMPRATSSPSYFAAATGGGGFEIDLSSAGAPQIRTARTPPLDFAGLPYMSVEIAGNDPKLPTEIVGLRFVDLADERGVVVQGFSKGGYRIDQLLSLHGDSGWMLEGLGPRLAVLHFGANETTELVDLATWEAHLRDAIDWIRQAMGNDEFPIVLVGEVHHAGLDVEEQAIFDGQPAVLAGLAEDDPGLAFVNLRRITAERYGWGPKDESFLIDTVHLSTEGQRMLARAFVDALHSLGRLEGDLDGDGEVGPADLSMLLSSWGTSGGAACASRADLDGSGVVDAGDVVRLLAAWTPSKP